MSGIKDLFSLFYWINNRKKLFLDASLDKPEKGNHKSDNNASAPNSVHERKSSKPSASKAKPKKKV